MVAPDRSGDNGAKRRNWEAVWKYAAIALSGLVLGMWEGQFQPNRQVVTQDQLATFSQKLDIVSQQEAATNADVAEIKGILKADGK